MANEQKIYWPKSGAKKIAFQNGGSMLKLNFHVSTAIEWLRENANDAGYITIGVTERRSPSDRGDTHCMWLDTWRPDASKARQAQPETRQHAAAHPTQSQTDQSPLPGDDDVPF